MSGVECVSSKSSEQVNFCSAHRFTIVAHKLTDIASINWRSFAGACFKI